MNKVKTYFGNIYKGVITAFIGMMVTGRYVFKRPCTLRYPEVRPKVPDRYRGILHNKIEDCTGCMACARACPVDCIHIKTTKRHPDNFGKASDGTGIKLWTTQFDIDMSLCMECGLCTYPCPTHCLTMSHQYELAVNDKKAMYLVFATEEDQVMAKQDEETLAKEKAEKEAKAAAAKAAEKKTEESGGAAAPKDPPDPAPKKSDGAGERSSEQEGES